MKIYNVQDPRRWHGRFMVLYDEIAHTIMATAYKLPDWVIYVDEEDD